ncbi:glycosyltransferase family 1 protein [Vibrio cholerae]|nr:glycosyltransferase family 1 protein [Vibrio cholerae]HDL9461736.1 glycosyltransferase family 4 protein [Vibrio cholerae]
MSRKKILLVSNAYWPSIGGIENSLRHLSEEAKKNGDYPEIIVSDIGALDMPTYEVHQSVPINRYRMKVSKIPIINFLISNYKAYRIYRNKFEEDSERIVIARFHLSALFAKLAGFKKVIYLVPSVVKFQCEKEMSETSTKYIRFRSILWIYIHNYLQKLALNNSDVFVFSETMRQQCSEVVGYELSAKITKPGVDSVRFKPINDKSTSIRSQLLINDEKKIVLFVGRFVKAKCVDYIITAVSSLDECVLLLIGEGQELESYREKISKLKLQDRVIIIPPTRDVEKYYSSADVFVMSSSYEPLGQTIIEALSSGLPVAAFKNSNNVKTATQELGMDDYICYAKDFNSQELSIAISTILSSSYDREKIHRSTVDKFSWSRLYTELVGRD